MILPVQLTVSVTGGKNSVTGQPEISFWSGPLSGGLSFHTPMSPSEAITVGELLIKTANQVVAENSQK